jgi:hypothetical protein
MLSPDDIPKMSDAELIRAYATAEFTGGAEYERRAEEWRVDSMRERPRYLAFRDIQDEIVRRGGERMMPALAELVRRERASDRPAPQTNFSGIGHFYSGDATDLLVKLRDPAAADVLVETLADARATATWRTGARRALERLTYVSYYLSEPHHNQYAETVPRTGATAPANPFKVDADASAVAAFYREWLDGEGKDPGRWLDLARARARAILAGDDLDSIYCIVSFLAPPHWDNPVDARRDDQPDVTVARVGQILAQCKYTPVRRAGERTQHSYTCNGRPLPVSVFNWTGLLARYGPRARAHVATIVRIQEECGLPAYSGLSNLLYIGGAEAVEYFAVCFPRVDRALAERDLVALARRASMTFEELPKDQTAREWVIAARIVT